MSTLAKLEHHAAMLRELLADVEARIEVKRQALPTARLASAPVVQEQPSVHEVLNETTAAQEPEKPWFEEDFGNCPDCGKELRLVPAGRNSRTGTKWDAFVGCKGFPGCSYGRPLTPEERAARETVREQHHETHLDVDHRSTNAANAFDLKEAILYELGNGGTYAAFGSVLVSTTKTKLWNKIVAKGKGGQGYHVFKAMLEELHTEGRLVLKKEPGSGRQADTWRIFPVLEKSAAHVY